MEFTSWHSYPSIYNLGHKAVAQILSSPVVIEEKVDGSQFSFGVFNGVLRTRSKGNQMDPFSTQGMFEPILKVVVDLYEQGLLTDGYTYRGEYLRIPKHNVLKYDRIPKQHLAIFDINDGHESYLSRDAKLAEAERLGFEVVPCYDPGEVTYDTIKELLKCRSFLGGVDIEGVVVKNYQMFGVDKKALMGKHVSEAFKEVHQKEWKTENTKSFILDTLALKYTHQGRWQKSVQHLRDAGVLLGEPKDIGGLIKAIAEDVKKECGDEIRDELFKWAWPHLSRAVVRGFPQWYKEQLLEKQFTQGEDHVANKCQLD